MEKNFNSYCTLWELLKFGSNLAKLKRAEENKVMAKIAELSRTLLSKLDSIICYITVKVGEIYTLKFQGSLYLDKNGLGREKVRVV